MVKTKNTKSFDLCFNINWTNIQLGGFQTIFFCGKYQLSAHKAWMLGAVREQIWFQIWTPRMGKSPAWAIFSTIGTTSDILWFLLGETSKWFSAAAPMTTYTIDQISVSDSWYKNNKKINISISNQYARDELLGGPVLLDDMVQRMVVAIEFFIGHS